MARRAALVGGASVSGAGVKGAPVSAATSRATPVRLRQSARLGVSLISKAVSSRSR